jgi:titin
VTPYVGSTAQTSRTFTSTATSQTITALTNATTYTFRVKAKNGNGVGPSGVSSPVIVGTPIAPTAVTGSGGNSQAIVHWTAPSSNNGAAVTGYVVTPYLGSTAQTAKTFNSTATTQTVTGLQNAKTYTFVVAAKNARGTGPGSSASAPVNTAPLIKPGSGSVVEGNSGTVPVNVAVTLSSAQTVPVTVHYTTLDTGSAGIATAGVDYVPASGTVTFAPGKTLTTVPITVYGDAIKEPPAYGGEWILVAFSNPTGGAVVDSSFYGLGIGVIIDDD